MAFLGGIDRDTGRSYIYDQPQLAYQSFQACHHTGFIHCADALLQRKGLVLKISSVKLTTSETGSDEMEVMVLESKETDFSGMARFLRGVD